MNSLLYFVLVFVALASSHAAAYLHGGHQQQSHRDDDADLPDFKTYLQRHNKDMNRLNDPERVESYENAVKFIRNHNEDATMTFKVHVNKFADWKPSEIESMIPGLHVEQEGYEAQKEKIEYEYDDTNEEENKNMALLGVSLGIGSMISMFLSFCGIFNGGFGNSYYYSYYNSYYGDNSYYYYYGGYGYGYSYGGGNRFWSSDGSEFNWATPANPQGFQVTPNVQDQEQCGSCWAFATATALTGNVNINSKKKVLDMLSVQEFLDCDTEAYGCSGGDPSLAMTYAIKNGLTDAQRYPYRNTYKESCQSAAKSPVASFSSYKLLPSNNEETLEEFVEKTPLTVNICASYASFIYYKSGVYDDHNCCQKGVDHAVLLVGYGRDKHSGEDYWILQNSWGASWGENGFIRLKKTDSSGSPGMCHIAYRPAMIMGGKRTSMWSTLDGGIGGIGGIGGGVAALVGILIFISVLFKRRKYYNYSSIEEDDVRTECSNSSIEIKHSFSDRELIVDDEGLVSISTEYQSS